jgi:hypothetical protein
MRWGVARAAQMKGPRWRLASRRAAPTTRTRLCGACVCCASPRRGKTVLAAHAVLLLARAWRHGRAGGGVAGASDTIRSQTLKARCRRRPPYRAALEAHYGPGVKVCALEDVAQNAPPDWRAPGGGRGGDDPEFPHRETGPQRLQLSRRSRPTSGARTHNAWRCCSPCPTRWWRLKRRRR